MTDDQAASNSLVGEDQEIPLESVWMKWIDQYLLIHANVATDFQSQILGVGKEERRKLRQSARKRLVSELDEAAKKMLETETNQEFLTEFARSWPEERASLMTEKYVPVTFTAENLALSKRIAQSWADAEESLMDKALETLDKRAAKRVQQEKDLAGQDRAG